MANLLKSSSKKREIKISNGLSRQKSDMRASELNWPNAEVDEKNRANIGIKENRRPRRQSCRFSVKKKKIKNNEVGYYCCLVSVLVAQCEIRTHRARALPSTRHFPSTYHHRSVTRVPLEKKNNRTLDDNYR